MLYELYGLGEHHRLLNTHWPFILPLTRYYRVGEIQVTVLTSLSVNTHDCLGTEIELLNSLKLSDLHLSPAYPGGRKARPYERAAHPLGRGGVNPRPQRTGVAPTPLRWNPTI